MKILYALLLLPALSFAGGNMPPSGDGGDGGDARATATGGDGRASVGDVSGGNASVEVGGVTVPVTTGPTTLTGGSVQGGDVSVGGDKSYALGMAGLGDVDLNEGRNCMGTEAFSIAVIAKQDMKLNPWCAALFYNANGKHEMAAKARCLLPEILHMSGNDEAQCIKDNKFAADGLPPQHTQKVLEILRQLQDKDEAEDKEHADEIMALEMRLEESEEKARKAILESRYAVREIQTAIQTTAEVNPVVQQEISAYEQRRQNAKLALSGEK